MTTSTSHDATATDGWMRRFAESAHATETRLTSLDQQVGDGDFGTNLTARRRRRPPPPRPAPRG